MHISIAALCILLGTPALAKYAVQTPPLDTPWTYKVGTDPWKEYPRPQLERSDWKSLNGVWKYHKSNSNTPQPIPRTFDQEVLVPSCIESGLSGIQSNDTLYSWFSTSFETPSSWKGDRTLLNFGAVDYEATVFVNGHKAGFHRGGYASFTLDVTQFLATGAKNDLTIHVHDPTDSNDFMIPLGKQTLRPSHIFYRPCSGIWQQVWIEKAPSNHVTRLDVSAGMDGKVNVTVHSSSGNSTPVEIIVHEKDSDKTLKSHKGNSDSAFNFEVDSPQLWSPDTPNLYNITVKMDKDKIHSYTGFRTFSKGEVNGIQRPLLNGKFVFQFGTLDQGYWPDGLYTPPSKEAMEYDLKALKTLGFNMVRKHIKVEPALFYRACDELGLIVTQDMPSMPLREPNPEQQKEFERQLDLLVNQHKSYPSIGTWVIYNEGWGQLIRGYPEFRLTQRVKELDPSRLVIATSGWTDHGAGDFHDNHHYANPQCGTPFYSIPSTPYDKKRIAIQGEFGGLGQNVSADHLWKVEAAFSSINQTYENHESVKSWNYKAHLLLSELRDQTEMYACSGGIWTQTTDVEGELNGLLTYDRRLSRPDERQWKDDIKALYDAAKKHGGGIHKEDDDDDDDDDEE